MEEGPSKFELNWSNDMRVRNNPIKIGNNVLEVYDSFEGVRSEFIIPDPVRQKYNRVAVSNGVIYLNGYVLNTQSGEWKRSFKSRIICWLLG